MERKHKFVILITAYNDEKWVEYNIASILNQTYSNYKVLYYDDASTDNTYQEVNKIVGNKRNFIVTTHKKNMQALFSYEECIKQIKEDEILVCMSADDWLYDDNVLKNLNDYYNNNDVWMTYGKFVAWDGENIIEANPQNQPYPDFTHNHKYYRKDQWRASHLRTFKGSLLKKVDLSEFKSDIDGVYFDHAADLALTYPCLEMCGKDKIGVLDFYSYVYNASPDVSQRTKNRESNQDNMKYELEIRNRKVYNKLKDINDIPKKLPQVNVWDYPQENNSIPSKFSYVYKQLDGEFDMTLLNDVNILKYLNGEIPISKGKIIADIHESPSYNVNQENVYSEVLKNYKKFDKIISFNKSLEHLPNFQLRLPVYSVLNKSIHKNIWPKLGDPTLFKIYEKNKDISCISSNKAFLPGHIKRLEFVRYIESMEPNINLFGVGFNEIEGKIEGLKDYRYSVAIENDTTTNGITEKIYDCFLSGVIPIYYGASNLKEYFNMDSILTFNNLEELKDILLNLKGEKGVEFYNNNLNSVKENFNITKNLWFDNDIFFDRYLKELL